MIQSSFEITKVRLYIDPATTSYVIQIVAGIIIACGAALGVFWNKITRFFRKKKEGRQSDANNQDVNSNSESGSVVTAEDLLSDEEIKGKNG